MKLLKTVVMVSDLFEVEDGVAKDSVQLEAHRLSMQEMFKDFTEKVNDEMEVDKSTSKIDVFAEVTLCKPERDLSHIDDDLIGEGVYCIVADVEGKHVLLSDCTVVGFTECGILARHGDDGIVDYVSNGYWYMSEDDAVVRYNELQAGE